MLQGTNKNIIQTYFRMSLMIQDRNISYSLTHSGKVDKNNSQDKEKKKYSHCNVFRCHKASRGANANAMTVVAFVHCK